jgi:hypothetical protein
MQERSHQVADLTAAYALPVKVQLPHWLLSIGSRPRSGLFPICMIEEPRKDERIGEAESREQFQE